MPYVDGMGGVVKQSGFDFKELSRSSFWGGEKVFLCRDFNQSMVVSGSPKIGGR